MTDTLKALDVNGVEIKIGDKVRRLGPNGDWLSDGDLDTVTDIVNLAAYENPTNWEVGYDPDIDIMVYTSRFPFAQFVDAGNFSTSLEVVE